MITISKTSRSTIVGNKIITKRKVVLYKFYIISDEDPEMAAYDDLYKWKQSPEGQFVFSRCQPIYNYWHNVAINGYEFSIQAEMEEKDITEFALRFSQTTKEQS